VRKGVRGLNEAFGSTEAIILSLIFLRCGKNKENAYKQGATIPASYWRKNRTKKQAAFRGQPYKTLVLGIHIVKKQV